MHSATNTDLSNALARAARSASDSYTFAHLLRLSDDGGIFEHALGTTPRLEHGYCTDDNARLLVVTSREDSNNDALALSELAMQFVIAAQDDHGLMRNRLSSQRCWQDEPASSDWWGRALWGLGTAAAHHPDPNVAANALSHFTLSAQVQSVEVRAQAFAALGAYEVLAVEPTHGLAQRVLKSFPSFLGPLVSADWRWPERTLRYANGSLAEALLVNGAFFSNDVSTRKAFAMLEWLVETETSTTSSLSTQSWKRNISVTGTTGRNASQRAPQFDQQSIEVAAIADACFRAFSMTAEPRWRDAVELCGQWFVGRNDAGVPMFDIRSGGGYDGLHHNRVNKNQGAESTLAYLSTMQRLRQINNAPTTPRDNVHTSPIRN